MRFSVLSSGSRANSTFLEAAGVRVLIDCGLSKQQTEKRLARLGITPDSLDVIILTHEHTDHIYGLSAFSRRHRLPVLCNRATAVHLDPACQLEYFETGTVFSLGGMTIRPFSIPHDASEPVAFVMEAEGLKFAQVTDLGKVSPLVIDALSGVNAIILEANHDEEMLYACNYPWDLKQRISSSHGHLSNEGCGRLLKEILHPGLRHVVLAHISENSNAPHLALETVRRYLSKHELATYLCADRHKETELIDVAFPADLVQAAASVA